MYVSALSIFVAVIATIGPRLVNETIELGTESMPEYAETIREESTTGTIGTRKPSPSIFASRLRPIRMRSEVVAAGAAKSALMVAFGTIQRVFGFLAGLLLLPLWTFYILKDQRRALDFFYNLWPKSIQPDVRNIVGIADRILAVLIFAANCYWAWSLVLQPSSDCISSVSTTPCRWRSWPDSSR